MSKQPRQDERGLDNLIEYIKKETKNNKLQNTVNKKTELKNKKKIYVVMGTWDQLIKIALLMSIMQEEGIDYEFIFTAQNKETISRILNFLKINWF